ncbi:unannotated protein [freshwater metagenome]|uniref:Unannotated protein n=1 Tax=freshwater metagenome TaxID=449393 RepID=A0A6J6R2T3_9ZZZZ
MIGVALFSRAGSAADVLEEPVPVGRLRTAVGVD